jgi:hypothetical protein
MPAARRLAGMMRQNASSIVTRGMRSFAPANWIRGGRGMDPTIGEGKSIYEHQT